MSYARFSEDSDVYVFLSVSGALECCGCNLPEPHTSGFKTTAEMLEHLEAHKRQGDKVPTVTIERLKAEAKENDAWIANPVEDWP